MKLGGRKFNYTFSNLTPKALSLTGRHTRDQKSWKRFFHREDTMPKAKPISLHPLKFDEAIKALIDVDPARVGLGKPQQKAKSKTKNKK